jgi:P2 family phage contractile tail tube protein
MKHDEQVIALEVYEDAVSQLGIADAKLPDVAFLSNTISGAGIAGKFEAIVPGMIEAMTTTLNFRAVTDAAISLLEPRAHKLDLRAPQQTRDSGTGQIAVTSIKHVLVVTPKKLGLGKAAPASTADVSGDYSTTYYALYKDGKKMIELDPMNFICIINGTDYLADVRLALGK